MIIQDVITFDIIDLHNLWWYFKKLSIQEKVLSLDDISHKQSFEPADPKLAHALFGQQNRHLRQIEKLTGVRVSSKGTTALLEGENDRLAYAQRLLEELVHLLEKGFPLRPADIEYAERILRVDDSVNLTDIFLDTITVTSRNRAIAQKKYLDAMRKNDVVFGIGPAGTGKTYLAMAMAVAMLKKKEVSRIVLVRPAVEAGEKLGFLPGDLAEKVNPYLRPLYDALYDLMDFDRGQALIDHGVIEVAPLAFMRGRTLNDAFVILDEAQNTDDRADENVSDAVGFWQPRCYYRGYHANRSAQWTRFRFDPGHGCAGPCQRCEFCELFRCGCSQTSDSQGDR